MSPTPGRSVTMVVVNHSRIMLRSSDFMCVWGSEVNGAAYEEVSVNC
jgi:hypothetical protein